MSRWREFKRQARGDVHREMSVPAFYFATPDADAIACTVRLWLKTDNHLVGDLQGFSGAERAEPEDRARFDLCEFGADAPPRRGGVLSVEAGEAYAIDFTYPADLGYLTARLTRLDAEEADGLEVPE